MLVNVTEDKFEESLGLSDVTLVDFYASWCLPCKMMAPIIEKLSEENEDINFIKIDIEDYPLLTARYRIMSVPTIAIFKGGEILYRRMGIINKEDLQKLLREAK